MDIFSHGLYGGIAFGRKSRRSYWTAFLFGILPDMLSFGIFFMIVVVSALSSGEFLFVRPEAGQHSIPNYVSSLYNITHSLVIFFSVFGLVWLLRKKPFWAMSAWGLHILIDIFTHSSDFFPTPFLWPISSYHFDGYSWGHLIIFVPNVLVLIGLYGYWLYKRKK